jgi:hypothetical protein
MSNAVAVQSSWMEHIERAIAENLRDYVSAYREAAPGVGAKSIEVAGGVAAFLGSGSPITAVKGVGARVTTKELEKIEDFFAGFGVKDPTIEIAPWLQESSLEVLRSRGYKPAATEDVVVRASGTESSRGISGVEEVSKGDWPELMRGAYELPDESPFRELVHACPRMPRGRSIGIRANEKWVACAQMHSYEGVMLFSCDGTVPSARGKGMQETLINYRLQALPSRSIAAAEVTPGGGSERNYLRCGFQIAYARTHWRKQLARS